MIYGNGFHCYHNDFCLNDLQGAPAFLGGTSHLPTQGGEAFVEGRGLKQWGHAGLGWRWRRTNCGGDKTVDVVVRGRDEGVGGTHHVRGCIRKAATAAARLAEQLAAVGGCGGGGGGGGGIPQSR